jgi:hypothetical protein
MCKTIPDHFVILFRKLKDKAQSKRRWSDFSILCKYSPSPKSPLSYPKKVLILVLTSWKALFCLEPTALEKVSSSKSHVIEQCHQVKGVNFWKNASLNTIICDTTYPLEFRSILAHGTRKLLLLDICKTIGQARQPDPR